MKVREDLIGKNIHVKGRTLKIDKSKAFSKKAEKLGLDVFEDESKEKAVEPEVKPDKKTRERVKKDIQDSLKPNAGNN